MRATPRVQRRAKAKDKTHVFGMKPSKFHIGQLVEPTDSMKRHMAFDVGIVIRAEAYSFKIEGNTLKNPQYRYIVVDGSGVTFNALEIEIQASSRNL